MGQGNRRGRDRNLPVILTLVAGVVAVCGPIGHIALLAPHLARRLATIDARRAFAPISPPTGIWTTAIGGPVLLFMLRRQLPGGRR